MRDLMMGNLPQLRHEPTEKRIRALLGGRTAVDSRRAVIVWEPRRIVPTYAVPVADVTAELVSTELQPDSGKPLLHPGIPFAAHSTPGRPYAVRLGDETRDQAAFQPDDADLAEHVLLDFDAFDGWLEEDEPVVSHPRDPYHRVDTRSSSRHVRIERDGVLLAESTRPVLLFETNLPTRYYLPREDVLAPTKPSDRRTYCAYKGEASYLTFEPGGDLAWYYPNPLPDAVGITGLVSFYNEMVDITVDGDNHDRPATEVSKSLVEEFGLK
jgi:uncharacterized protein (DUF427 family)